MNSYPYLATIITVLIVDFIWLYLNRDRYQKLVRKVQGFALNINILGAILSYICVIVGLFVFSIPMIKYHKNNKQSLFELSMIYGGGLGLIMYGIFNTTNLGLFKNYDLTTAIIDTIWGFFIFTFASYLFIKLEDKN